MLDYDDVQSRMEGALLDVLFTLYCTRTHISLIVVCEANHLLLAACFETGSTCNPGSGECV